MPVRKIIKIDEDKCDGCGLCIPSCAEGALQMVDGKAKLVSEAFCDGLGACLGECPRNAITIEEREAVEFSETDAKKHLEISGSPARSVSEMASPFNTIQRAQCPGSASQSLRMAMIQESEKYDKRGTRQPSTLANWPVQISLAPYKAPYFDNAKLLIAADCVPFAFADFHREILDGCVALIGCPKLDNMDSYRAKLARIFSENDIQSIEIAYMEVPCCFGLVVLIRMALEDANKEIPVVMHKIGVRGDIQKTSAKKEEKKA